MVCHNNTDGGPFRVFRSLGSKVQHGPYGPGSNVGPLAHLYKMLLFLQFLLYRNDDLSLIIVCWWSLQGVQSCLKSMVQYGP